MSKTFRIILAVFAMAITSLYSLATPSLAKQPPVYQSIVKGVAVGGYDPVAYFQQGKPVRGLKSISYKHNGATWRFSSVANLEKFKKDPSSYAPQYGGYCAWAVSKGYTAKGDPHAWKIHKGKLYLNYNKSVRATWARNIPGHVRNGDKNWPKVLGK